jgi:hypothetical protein
MEKSIMRVSIMPAVKNLEAAEHIAKGFLESKGIEKSSVEGVTRERDTWRIRLIGPRMISHIVEIDANTGEVTGYQERE